MSDGNMYTCCRSDVRMVNKVVKTLKDTCFACVSNTCSGLECVMVPTKSKNLPAPGIYKQHWCNVCFGVTVGQGAFHSSNVQYASAKKFHCARWRKYHIQQTYAATVVCFLMTP